MTGPLDRLDGSRYGDPDDHRPAHVAPVCEGCRTREARDSLDGVPLCEDCLLDRLDQDDAED